MPYRKGIRGRADRLWAGYIKSLGYCERCGDSSGPFEAAHIVRRGHQGVRCDPGDGWCLCHRCHQTVDLWPDEFNDLVRKTVTEDGFDRLVAKARASSGVRLSDAWWRDVCDELELLTRQREGLA